jgi:hypothetical protein
VFEKATAPSLLLSASIWTMARTTSGACTRHPGWGKLGIAMLTGLFLDALVKSALKRWLRGESDQAPIQTGITESGFDVFEIPQPAIPFENPGTAPFTVKREFSAEWTQTLEIRQEDRRMQRVGVSAERWVKLEASAEKAITQTYGGDSWPSRDDKDGDRV